MDADAAPKVRQILNDDEKLAIVLVSLFGARPLSEVIE